jgi:hypothetical protein
VLPHLITSTDEFSLFIMNQIINNKVSWYFTARPSCNLKPNVASDHRDCYTTDLHGNAHLRGLRITLNNTFTAGGQCAPIFACVFGLSLTEMPCDEIIIAKCKGLVAASNVNGSMEMGYIVFIRGNYSPKEPTVDSSSSTAPETSSISDQPNCRTDDTNNNFCSTNPSDKSCEPKYDTKSYSNSKEEMTESTNDTSLSKESRVAKIYWEMVYYPFIEKIRKNNYNMETDDGSIPDNLTAVSWMDGCHGQLKLITTEDV